MLLASEQRETILNYITRPEEENLRELLLASSRAGGLIDHYKQLEFEDLLKNSMKLLESYEKDPIFSFGNVNKALTKDIKEKIIIKSLIPYTQF